MKLVIRLVKDSILKEGLVVSIGRAIRKKTVSGRIRQLSIDLSRIIILVEDHSGIALFCWKDMEMGNGPEEVEDLALKIG